MTARKQPQLNVAGVDVDPSVLMLGRAKCMFDVAHDHLNVGEQVAKAADDADACLAYLNAARAIVYALQGVAVAIAGTKP